MGTDYYAQTVIGIRVPRSKLIGEEVGYMNNCICTPKTYSFTRYCPNCGRETKREVRTNKPLFQELADKQGYMEDMSLLGWPVRQDFSDAKHFYIGMHASGLVNHDSRMDLPDLSEDVIHEFRSDMNSLDLWDEENFGLWTILLCSH